VAIDLQSLLSLLSLVSVAFGFGLAFLWWRSSTRTGRHNRRRLRVAQRGERGAEAVLVGHGYTVVERQLSAAWMLTVDGATIEVTCRADLLVSRLGRRYIAEVKTGARAPNPAHPQTRRQLLEYRLAFQVHGVLLVDMESAQVMRVEFPPDQPS